MFGQLLRRGAPSEQRAMQVTPWGDWGSGSASTAGMNVTIESSTQLLAVYGSVQLIADTIATLPRDIYRERSDVTEEVTVKPRWFEQPNPHTDIIEFLTQSLHSLLLDGNAYWAYSVDLNFAPTELRVLNPRVVDVRPSAARTPTPVYFVNGERFTGRLLHIKGLSQPAALKGLSPIENARQSLGLGLAAQEFAGNFYKNGTKLSGAITTPGQLTLDQARDLKTTWSRDHGGVSNAHLPAVLTNGATWQQISVTPEQAQFLQSRQWQAAEIAAQMFLLDPTMLGIQSAAGQNLTYANLEQRGIHLVQFTLLRWIIRLERAFTSLLPKPQFMKFNVAALERADLKTRYEAHRIALGPNTPWEKVNEVRDLEDLPPVPGGDTLPEPTAPAAPVAAPASETAPIQNSFEFVMPEIRLPEHPVPVVNVTAEPTPVEVHNHVAPAEHQIVVSPTPLEINNVIPDQPAAVVNVTVDPTPLEITNHVATPEVRVEAPNVQVDAPIIHNHPPDVNVDVAAPNVTVEQPNVQVDVAAPEVNVQPPNVTVEAPEVTVNQAPITVEPAPLTVNPTPIRIDAPKIILPAQKKIRRTFERDEQGITIAIIEEPIEDEAPEPANEDT